MKNKYLDNLGIKTHKNKVTGGGDAKDTKKFKNQRKKYGFDSRECWNLDYTSAVWLYSHLKRFVKDTKDTIDLAHHSFSVPVIYDRDKNETGEAYKSWYIIKFEEHTQEDCIKLCISYLKEYLIATKGREESWSSFSETINLEIQAMEKLQCAFKIYAELLPAMQW